MHTCVDLLLSMSLLSCCRGPLARPGYAPWESTRQTPPPPATRVAPDSTTRMIMLQPRALAAPLESTNPRRAPTRMEASIWPWTARPTLRPATTATWDATRVIRAKGLGSRQFDETGQRNTNHAVLSAHARPFCHTRVLIQQRPWCHTVDTRPWFGLDHVRPIMASNY